MGVGGVGVGVGVGQMGAHGRGLVSRAVQVADAPTLRQSGLFLPSTTVSFTEVHGQQAGGERGKGNFVTLPAKQ